MRIAVTGGSGFIGTNLVEYCYANGIEVRNLDLAPPRNPAHAGLWHACDIRNADEVARAVRAYAPTHLFHLAARTDLDGRTLEDYAANIDGVSNLIAAVACAPSVQRVVFASSRLVCRIGYRPSGPHDYCPDTLYGESKVEGERRVYAAAKALPSWLIVRPTSIWGPWFDAPYRGFFDAVRRGLYLHPRGRRVAKSFGFVGNTVAQLYGLMRAPAAAVNGRMFYLCDAPALDLLTFAQAIGDAFAAPRVREVPLPILRLGAAAGDVLKRVGVRNPPLTTFRLRNLLTPMEHDVSELEAVCGPSRIPMADGIAQTVRWMREHGGSMQSHGPTNSSKARSNADESAASSNEHQPPTSRRPGS